MQRKSIGYVRFYADPLRMMARWAVRRYALSSFDVAFRSGILANGKRRRLGCTSIFRKRRPLIDLSVCCPYKKLVKVLAHEIAHLICLKRNGYAGHKCAYADTLRELICAWNRYVEN